MVQSFKRWLAKQATRSDAVGDLARDGQMDDFEGKTMKSWREHLEERGAEPPAMRAFRKARREYRAYRASELSHR